MTEQDDQLISEYNNSRSEQAFAALVQRHLHLVFGTALRLVSDRGQAEEITQSVFLALAQSAGKLGRPRTLAGWLYQTTVNKSRERLRSELRRQRREQIAVNLETAKVEGVSVWATLVPLLDEALLELREPDRLAVILHFMEEQTFREVGAVLGLHEDAARKRINRCLDQLTNFFRRHGLAVPALAAGAPLFTLSAPAAPAGLAASITAASLAAAPAAATGIGLLTTKVMAMTKLQMSLAGALVVAGVATPLVLQHQTLNRVERENQALRQQLVTPEQPREQILSTPPAALKEQQYSELLALRGEVGRLRQQTGELAMLRIEAEQLRAGLLTAQKRIANTEAPVTFPPTQPDSNAVASATAIIFNPGIGVTEKLAALRTLRSAKARPDDVVRQMVQVYYSTDNPSARADIFRQLHGVTTAELKRPLLEAISDVSNPSNVREEAAETLTPYLTDPEVKKWLDHLAAQDPDEKVRAQAAESLQRFAR